MTEQAKCEHGFPPDMRCDLCFKLARPEAQPPQADRFIKVRRYDLKKSVSLSHPPAPTVKSEQFFTEQIDDGPVVKVPLTPAHPFYEPPAAPAPSAREWLANNDVPDRIVVVENTPRWALKKNPSVSDLMELYAASLREQLAQRNNEFNVASQALAEARELLARVQDHICSAGASEFTHDEIMAEINDALASSQSTPPKRSHEQRPE